MVVCLIKNQTDSLVLFKMILIGIFILISKKYNIQKRFLFFCHIIVLFNLLYCITLKYILKLSKLDCVLNAINLLQRKKNVQEKMRRINK